MMQAVQLVYAGDLFAQPAWKERGLVLAREIHRLFAEHETFAEFNSPTYYGVNLYALRLWRFESIAPELQVMGAKMEKALWKHVARYYHPGLRNICGPYDRSYGMDMTKYTSGIGLWMRLELEPKSAPAPSPALSDDFGHRHDFAVAPVVALLGTEIPAAVRRALREAPQERIFRQVIETKPENRNATAYMKADRMWGGESGSLACRSDQLHYATAHWLQPDGTVGWLRLENEASVDVMATVQGLKLTAANGATQARLTWHFSSRPVVTPEQWELPGMIVHVKTFLPTPTFAVGKDGRHALIYELAPVQKAEMILEFCAGKS